MAVTQAFTQSLSETDFCPNLKITLKPHTLSPLKPAPKYLPLSRRLIEESPDLYNIIGDE